ncbi:MAG: hypothetical protein MI749_20220 [Desulfovibrionales bacterium]|nr:hypothetical protein [Desulfovibrionales bacterium]
MTNAIDRLIQQLWLPVMFLMAITGMGQMPIFKRYYVADIPGLAWLGEPYTVHWVHYAGAALLMFLVVWFSIRWLVEQPPLGKAALVRIVIFLMLILTGYARVLKNLSDVHFSPIATMLVDWSHLSFAILLGLVAVWRWGFSRK